MAEKATPSHLRRPSTPAATTGTWPTGTTFCGNEALKKELGWILLGAGIAVSGSLIAASITLLYQFSAGTKAKASEVNTNFNSLASAVNNLDSRVGGLEQSSGNSQSIEHFTTNQIDLPVGTAISVGGVSYTIRQVEVPRLDTDEIYLLKAPVQGNSPYIQVIVENFIRSANYGRPFTADTTLNGFKLLANEVITVYTDSNGSQGFDEA